MINRYHGTDIVESYDDFRHTTCYKHLPRTEEKVIERMVKLMKVMQKQGQHFDLEIVYRLLDMMADPNDQGSLSGFLHALYRAAANGISDEKLRCARIFLE